MAKHKVAELEGSLLDLAVAVALEIPVFYMGSLEWSNSTVNAAMRTQKVVVKNLVGRLVIQSYDYGSEEWSPSTDWAQGGPLIEQHKISTELFWQVNGRGLIDWRACMTPRGIGEQRRFGFAAETPLIAAMRCLVASKFGEWVKLPV